jgi:hypothetical protein
VKPAWYDGFDHYFINPKKHALAFSACCKVTRRIVFLERIMREVTVGLNEQEMSDFAALSYGLRSHVR